MIKINELIQEGEKLRNTFTEEGFGSNLTNDRVGVSEWITKSMRIIEMEESQGCKSKLYKEFENWIGSIGNMSINDCNDLLGILKGIDATTTNEEETVFF